MKDARATNEWPYNKCDDIGVIMLQMCVCVFVWGNVTLLGRVMLLEMI